MCCLYLISINHVLLKKVKKFESVTNSGDIVIPAFWTALGLVSVTYLSIYLSVYPYTAYNLCCQASAGISFTKHKGLRGVPTQARILHRDSSHHWCYEPSGSSIKLSDLSIDAEHGWGRNTVLIRCGKEMISPSLQHSSLLYPPLLWQPWQHTMTITEIAYYRWQFRES